MKLEVKMVNWAHIDMLVQFEQEARITEPDIFIDGFDACELKQQLESAIKNPAFASAHCMICVNSDEKILGRIDFSVISSFAFGGNTQIYIDWIYVLKEFRHIGVAQLLFSKMEEHIKSIGMDEYFLLTAENSEAQKFYHSVEGAVVYNAEILRKHV